MRYDKIIFVGTGSLLTNCLRHAIQTGLGCSIECIETEKQAISALNSLCAKAGIAYFNAGSKEELNGKLLNENEAALIFSIHNGYIFRKEVISKSNLKIVNFHNSLLPKHPGRNAPSWAIFEMNTESGITWHEVVPAVDRGNIVRQASVLLNGSMTAMDLTRNCVNMGYESFKEIFPLLLEGELEAFEQPDGDFTMHYSYEIPNNGILDTGWTVEKMSAFLRAMDYGAFPVFPKPLVVLNEETYVIEKYSISPAGENDIIQDGELNFKSPDLNIKLKLQKQYARNNVNSK